MAAAKAIENQLRAERSLSEAHQHLAELNIALQTIRREIVFLDPAGKVTHIDTRAGDIMGISQPEWPTLWVSGALPCGGR